MFMATLSIYIGFEYLRKIVMSKLTKPYYSVSYAEWNDMCLRELQFKKRNHPDNRAISLVKMPDANPERGLSIHRP